MKFKHDLPRIEVVNRNHFILNKAKGQKVLNLGPVDRALNPIADQHRKLMEVADNVVGIDIDKEGINELRNIGITNVIYGNIEYIDEITLEEDVSLIIAGEIIEHLSNPGLFLEKIKKFFAPQTQMIITTPNAFSFQRFVPPIIFRKEYVHEQHTCYYSFNTLSSLLARHGFDIDNIYSFTLGRKFEVIYKIFPHLSTGLIFVVSLSKSPDKLIK